MNKQTQGEWEFKRLKDDESQLLGFGVFAGGDRILIFSKDEYGYGHEDEAEANAKLIAAAPDLLKALKSLVGIEVWIADRQMKEHFQNVVYPAIKKATE